MLAKVIGCFINLGLLYFWWGRSRLCKESGERYSIGLQDVEVHDCSSNTVQLSASFVSSWLSSCLLSFLAYFACFCISFSVYTNKGAFACFTSWSPSLYPFPCMIEVTYDFLDYRLTPFSQFSFSLSLLAFISSQTDSRDSLEASSSCKLGLRNISIHMHKIRHHESTNPTGQPQKKPSHMQGIITINNFFQGRTFQHTPTCMSVRNLY